ncbi:MULTISPECIES: DUF3800 domain-containing protein [Halomicrobium]|nr:MULTISPECIES: DUF3800 domain-containing protein [Halomicrobium]QCD64850.1 hypothetical protein E5139_04055 [Halomicrobium mukohataei]QFR19656.1 hypothetical protein GBQ70_04050 [Halomicrobium sp. ZPS1]
MDEAKWYDMKTVEKRRFMECLGENSPPLEFGYAVFELDDFTNLRSHYKLFQDVSFPPIWDIAIRGIAYTEILYELSGDTNIEFYPDQFRSGVQTDKLCEVIENRLKKAEIECVSSEQVDGVQAADCLAGAVAEEQKGGTPWLEHTNAESQIAECSSWTLIELERLLVS